MKTSSEINELAKAMAEAQNKIRPADKDGLNPHFKSKYTSIASVWEALREPMTSNGLTVWQDVTTNEKGVSVETRIVHASGQWVEFGPLTMPVGKQDAQGFGSIISYAKRYALCASIGIVSSDQDDDAGSGVDKKTGEIKNPPKEITPLNQIQIEQIKALEEAIEDKTWISNLKERIRVKEFSEINPDDFKRLIITLEQKVSG